MEFSDAAGALDAALAAGQLGPRDAERRVNLTKELEATVRNLEAPPVVEPARISTKLARLLWFKSHLESLDLEDLFSAFGDADEVVRLTAAEVLLNDVRTSPRWSDTELNSRARHAVTLCLGREVSATVSMQMSEVLKNLLQGRRRKPEPSTAPTKANPYVTGLPVRGTEGFFDRECIIQDIRQAIETNRHTVVVHGARRTGKTSLLYRIRDGVLGPEYVAAYIDMQSLAGLPLPLLVRNFIRAVESALWEKNIGGISPVEGEYHLGMLEQYLSQVAAQLDSRSLLLLIDEYEVLQSYLGSEDVRHQLQAILGRDWKVFAIFAGEKMEAIGEKNLVSLLDNAAYLKITFLSSEDTRRLITRPAAGLLEFSAEAIGFIEELTAGHPFYIQLLCQAIFASGKGRGQVTRKDVEAAVVRFIDNPAPNLLLSWKQNLTLTERIVTSALAAVSTSGAATARDILTHLTRVKYPIRLGLRETHMALSRLERDDWVKRETPGQDGEAPYAFTMGLVRRWIERSNSIWDLLYEQQAHISALAPSPVIRNASMLVDVAIAIVAACLVAFVSNTISQTGIPWQLTMEAVVFGLYIVPLVSIDRTLGMWLFRTRIASELGESPTVAAALQFGAGAASPAGIAAAALLLDLGGGPVLRVLVTLAALFLLAVHQFLVRRRNRENGQGVFDRFARVIVIRSSKGAKQR